MLQDWNLDALESRCLPAVTILLDVDGEPAIRKWTSWRVTATPAPLIDVDYVVRRVREAFALFPNINIDVESGPSSRSRGPVIIIGGNGAWLDNRRSGGVAQINGAFIGERRAFVFSDNLIGPEHIARLVVHEAGHMLGLPHTPGDSYMGAPFSRFALWADQDAERLARIK